MNSLTGKNGFYVFLELFKYYGHREKLKVIGREQQVKELNLKALKLAKEVAVKTGTLMAGNICNTTVFQKGNDTAIEAARAMFKVLYLMQSFSLLCCIFF